jgi:photosystem II stability/assembly factor-like uncharacterized protein
MFQRQIRQPFPVRNIIILAVAVLLFFLYIANNLKRKTAAVLPRERENEYVKRDTGLSPNEWFYVLREYPDYKIDVATYEKAMQQAVAPVADRNGYPGFSTPWSVEGPGNIGARINTIKVHPTNPNIIYVGYACGGVWKTTNGGISWLPIFDQQAFLSVGDIELDPQNPQIVYVGTGDPNIGGYPFIGDGLWKSPDGGQTWQHLGLVPQRIISKIVIHPTDPKTLYVAAMGLPFERNNDRGVYKTSDGGQTWKQVLFVSNQSGAIDLQISPANPNTLYAAIWDRIRSEKESVVSGSNARIWKTTDGGANWAILTNGLPADNRSRIGLDIDRQNANHLVAIYVGTNLNFDRAYETFNAGQSWQTVDTTGLDIGFQAGFGWYFGKIFINPYNTSELFLCGVELWRSTDGGHTWGQANPDWWNYSVHADKHDMAFVDAQTYLLATDGGLYRTTDDATTWTKIENNPCSQFYRVAYNPFRPDLYYGGAQDNGTTAGNKNNLANWPRLFGGDGFQPVFHPLDSSMYYYEYQNGAIQAYNASAGYFDDATIGIDPADRKSWDMQYILSQHDFDITYTGTYRVYQGFGYPATWAPISGDLTDGINDRYHLISAIHESPVSPDYLYVGTSDGNVWLGNPATQVWTNITAGLPDRYVSSVKGSPTVANRVFVAHTGYKVNDFTPHIHRSDNLGATWTAISGDLPNLAVNDLLVLPGHQDSIILAATDGGVYGTRNGGLHWERLGTGMPVIPVYDIEINPAQKTVFAGTHGRSIFSFPLDSLIHSGNVSTYTPPGQAAPEMKVLPSLVTDHAKIRVQNLKPRETADVFITDLNGRLVWQTEFKGYHSQEMPFEPADLPAGIYIAFAKTNGKIWATQKFVIAR